MPTASRLLLGLLLLATVQIDGPAQDFSIVTFSLSGTPPGGQIIQSIGDTTNSLTYLIMGPGMYLVMAIGAVLVLYGWSRGNKESLWSGLTLFILAALLRALFAYL